MILSKIWCKLNHSMLSNTGEVTEFIRQMHVFLKKTTIQRFWATLQLILRYTWNGKIYNELNFLIKSTLWQIIKITIITIKTNQWHWLATKESYFIFNKVLYKQKDGVVMGSPLGPTSANAFLCFYERKWLEECPSEFKPVFYRRYVDDIFALVKSTSHLEKLL